MQVLRAQIVKMAVALGFKAANTWSRTKMEEKLVEIADMAKTDETEIDDEDLNALLKRVVECGGKLTVCKDESELGDAAPASTASPIDKADPASIGKPQEEADKDDTRTAEEINAEIGKAAGVKKGKKAKAPKEPKAPKTPKAPKAVKEKDRFGSVVGSQLAKVNAVLSSEPKTMNQIMEAAESTETFYTHMRKLIAGGFVRKTDKGFQLA